MEQPKILTLSGSIRSGSVNTRLLGAVMRELANLDANVTRITLEDYTLPIYDGDLEKEKGIPENAVKLAKLFDGHDAIVIVSPEYNGSLTPLLKNTIDWISRVKEADGQTISPYSGKVGLIAACSPGAMGGMSMLYHLRDILVRLGVMVISEQVAVGGGNSAFDDTDRLTNERVAGLLKSACKSLNTKAALLKKV